MSRGRTRVQASTTRDVLRAWAPDQRELFCTDATNVWAADVSGGNHIDIGTPRKLFRVPEGALFQDVAPDGQHVLLLQRTPAPPPPIIRFISGWLETVTVRAVP